MKYTLILLLNLITLINNAQEVTTIFNEVSNSAGLAVDGNNLYIATSRSIYKLDWTENNPTASIFVEINGGRQGIAINQGYLYICLDFNNPANDKVVRVDLNQSNPIVENFIILDDPNGIVFRNNIMYVSSGRKIFYVDTDISNPSPIEIINDVNNAFGTIGLCIIDNFLFVSEHNQIVKYDIDLSNPTKEIVVTGISSVTGITKHTDEKLFFVSYSPEDMIYELDIISETYSALFPSNLITPWDITYANDFLLVSNLEGGEVNKIDISSLSIVDFNNQSLIIYPNPVSDFIKVKNLEEIKKAVVFDILGQKIIEEEIGTEAEIDVRNLSEGIYYLKIGNKLQTKFIKKEN